MSLDQANPNQVSDGRPQFTEETISIPSYTSAAALKDEIRNKIKERSKSNWDVIEVSVHGSSIRLKFKPRN